MSLCRNFVAESTDPSAGYSQQNLLNFRSTECSSAEYFIAENFRSHNVDLSTDYLQQNLLNSIMFFGRLFAADCSSADCSRQTVRGRLFTVEYFATEFCIPAVPFTEYPTTKFSTTNLRFVLKITCSTNYATPPSLFKSRSSLMPMSHPRRTLKQSAETIAHSHPAVNRVACLIATENYYVVFIEGVLLQGHSATRIKKHDVPGRCWHVMGNSILEAADFWLLLANHEARDVASSI
nr:hypothetical protein CFP56_37915 [Quercus suber]